MSTFWIGSVNYGQYVADIGPLKRAQARARRHRHRVERELKLEVEELRTQVEFLTLALTSLLVHGEDSGTLSRETFSSVMRLVDEADGELDGRLPVDVLAEMIRGVGDGDVEPDHD